MVTSVWKPIQRGIGFGQETPPPRSFIGFIKKVFYDWSFVFAAALAYGFLVALSPLLVTSFAILGLVLRTDPGTRNAIIDAVVRTVPDNTTQIAVREVADKAVSDLDSDAIAIFIIGVIFSLIGGSRLFTTMDDVFTIIYRTPERSFIRRNLLAIGMLLLFIVFTMLAYVIAGVPSFVINALPNKDGAQFGIFVAGIFISFILEFLIFMLIYFVIPYKKMKLRHIWCGSLLAAFFLELFLTLFPLYIRRFSNTFVGLIGFAVLLITFFFYLGVILILCAQINAYFFERIQPLPDSLGDFLNEFVEKSKKRAALPITQYRPRTRPRTKQRY